MTSDRKPSRTSEPAPWWLELQSMGLLSAQEVEQRRLGVERCEQLFASDPWYQAQAAADRWWWHKYMDSQANW